jgi:multiple sugar transport system substrate-binding protein
MKQRHLGIAAIAATSVLLFSGCAAGGSDGGDANTLKVAYQKFGQFTQMDAHMKKVKDEFERANEGMTVELVPIEAQEADYFAKLALMNRSAATAPDVMYEDTFMVKTDVEAGYLAPLDDYIADWEDWEQFPENARQAGAGDDGKIYGIPMGTDTRAIWYNQEILSAAGVEVPWAPTTWDDVLETAEAVKAYDPEIVPFNIYSGKGQSEGASMQGFQMLLSGTEDELFDADEQKWILGSQGFEDSLGFIEDIYQGGLGPTPQQALDKNIGTTINSEWIPGGTLAMSLDGSWASGTWIETGSSPWPEWSDVMQVAAMPTQEGQEPGRTSMSGGWTLAMGAGSQNKDAAWDFISTALSQENSLSYDVAASQVAVRTDVAEDPEYTDANPTFGFFSELVSDTHFRPANSDYSKISAEITVAMESVMTGQQTPEEAAATYDQAVIGIVGEENTVAASN